MEACGREMDPDLLPSFFSRIRGKYRGDYARFAEKMYDATLFGKKEKVLQLLERYRKDPERARTMMDKDPLAACLDEFGTLFMTRIDPVYGQLQQRLEDLYKTYMAARLEMSEDRRLYPDANFTMRVTHGNVEGYRPLDGIKYEYATTLSGVIEKAREGTEDYRVPAKLVELYDAKDYGRYGVNGTMPVCFLASNHTSGGNSGSPVLDACGRLVGINFDRNWEGTMSDVYYDPSLCRNIAVDIRYVLFIMDKFAGAGYLLEEMDIAW